MADVIGPLTPLAPFPPRDRCRSATRGQKYAAGTLSLLAVNPRETVGGPVVIGGVDGSAHFSFELFTRIGRLVIDHRSRAPFLTRISPKANDDEAWRERGREGGGGLARFCAGILRCFGARLIGDGAVFGLGVEG